MGFEDIRHVFMSPNFVVPNKEGKTVFEMKRKTPMRPDGTEECYYLFKFYDENMPDEEVKTQFHEVFKEFMCPLAALMDIGMFSFDEVSKRCNEQVKKIYESGRELTETQIDISIEVLNHATNHLGKLTVGVSTKPVEWVRGLRRRFE